MANSFILGFICPASGAVCKSIDQVVACLVNSKYSHTLLICRGFVSSISYLLQFNKPLLLGRCGFSYFYADSWRTHHGNLIETKSREFETVIIEHGNAKIIDVDITTTIALDQVLSHDFLWYADKSLKPRPLKWWYALD